MLTFRSYNMPGRIGREAVRRDLSWITRGADGVVLQEARHVDAGALAVLPARWRHYRGQDNGALTILVDRQASEVTGQRSERAFPDWPVGKWGAGPSTLKAGWAHGVRILQDGVETWLFDAHLPPSVTRPAFTKKTRAARKERRRLHALEVDQLLRITDDLERVVIMGDFNAPPHYPGLRPLIDAGFRMAHLGATHRGSRIDHAFVRGCKIVSSRTMLRRASDHLPIEVVVK